MTRKPLATDVLGKRFWLMHTGTLCFVCCLEVGTTTGWVRIHWTQDAHSRIAHAFCWDLVLRYAQDKISEQAVTE